MVKTQLDKKTAIMGTGAGVGLVQAYLTRDVLDAMYGPIPGLETLGVWGTYSTLGNIVIGGVAFGVSAFTSMAKGNLQTFLQGYGFVTLLGGLFNGIFPNLQMAARMRGANSPSMSKAPVTRIPPRALPGNGGIILT